MLAVVAQTKISLSTGKQSSVTCDRQRIFVERFGKPTRILGLADWLIQACDGTQTLEHMPTASCALAEAVVLH